MTEPTIQDPEGGAVARLHERARPIRYDIEGLRALAVLAVLVNHAFPKALGGGFAGVDIFFVISGYLIGGHLLEDIQNGRLNIRGFYAKRARRLFPALALVLICVWAVGWRYFSAPELAALGRHIVAAVCFSNNFLLWLQSGYFDTVALEKPLLHLWSLGIEEQFYLLVPGMLWLGSRGLHGSIRWVARAGALSLLTTILVSHCEYSATFYLLHTRFWELAAGVVLAQAQLRTQAHASQGSGDAAVSRSDGREILLISSAIFLASVTVLGASAAHWDSEAILEDLGLVLTLIGAVSAVFLSDRSLRRPSGAPLAYGWAQHDIVDFAIPAAGLLLIALSVTALTSEDWPGPKTVLPVLGAVLVIAARPTGALNRFLGCKPLVFVGGISYPLYLWHWPAIVTFRLLRPDAAAAELVIPLAASFALAWLTKILVEDPVRFGKLGTSAFRRPSPRFVVSSLAIVGMLGMLAIAGDGLPSRFPPQLRGIASWSEDNKAAWRMGHCYFHWSSFEDFASECTPKKRPGVPLVLLWGDSHAADLYSGMRAVQSKMAIDIAQWTVAGCPPTVKPYRGGKACVAWGVRAMDRLAKFNPDTIVLAGAWERYMESGLYPDQIIDMLFDTVRRLKQLGIRHIVVFGPGPLWRISLPVDLFRYMVNTRAERIPERLGTVSDAIWSLDAAMAARAAAENVQYMSVVGYFCDKTGCRTVGNGALAGPDLLYRDRDHLSMTGSKLLIAHAEPQLFGAPAGTGAPIALGSIR